MKALDRTLQAWAKEYRAVSCNPNISTTEQIDLIRRGMNEKTKEIQAMKMGEFDTFMNDLAEVSGVPREILDKTPARALFALKSAIDERDRAQAKSDPPAEPLWCVECGRDGGYHYDTCSKAERGDP